MGTAALCRDIATPAARICYEELQVVAAELPENFVLCSTIRTARTLATQDYLSGIVPRKGPPCLGVFNDPASLNAVLIEVGVESRQRP